MLRCPPSNSRISSILFGLTNSKSLLPKSDKLSAFLSSRGVLALMKNWSDSQITDNEALPNHPEFRFYRSDMDDRRGGRVFFGVKRYMSSSVLGLPSQLSSSHISLLWCRAFQARFLGFATDFQAKETSQLIYRIPCVTDGSRRQRQLHHVSNTL